MIKKDLAMREYRIKDLVNRIQDEQRLLENNKSDENDTSFSYKLNFVQKRIILWGNSEQI